MNSFCFKTGALVLVFMSLFSIQAGASEDIEGFVQINSKRQIWVDYVAPKKQLPTLVVLNGLTYSTRQWDKFVAPLEQAGFGILRYDMHGMGKTLLKHAPINYTITYKQQVEDLDRLLSVMEIEGPYNLIGLSYGGGIAMAYADEFPENVNQLILIAPYTEKLQGQDTWIRNQVAATRMMQPWNPATDEELYDFFLRQNIYLTYPAAEPIILENPYKLEATFRLVQGIRKWNASSAYSSFPKGSVHLMIAEKDQYIPDPVLADFWKGVPKAARGSLVVVGKTEHKIPEAYPKFVAAWARELLLNNEKISKGVEFIADPGTGIVTFEGGQFRLKL